MNQMIKILLGTIICGVTLFVLGIWTGSRMLFFQNNHVVVATSIVVATTSPIVETEKTAQSKSESIAQSYLNSSYRVIGVIPGDNDGVHYSMVVATKRAIPGPTSVNDTGCGGLYVSPTCYFFLEPDYYYDVQGESVRLIAMGGLGASISNPINAKFIDKNNFRFVASTGDAGASIQAEYNLNLKTGEITKVYFETREWIGPLDNDVHIEASTTEIKPLIIKSWLK